MATYDTKKIGKIKYYHFPKENSFSFPKDMYKWWVTQMERYINEFLSVTYGKMLRIHVTINNRLTTTHAWFVTYYKRACPPHIEMSSRMLKGAMLLTGTPDEEGAYKAIESTLRHEAIHYALYHLRLPHSDGYDTFEKDLFITGTGASGATNESSVYKSIIPATLTTGYLAICPVCGKENVNRTTGRYRCASCMKEGKKHIYTAKKELMVGIEYNKERGRKEYDGSYSGEVKLPLKTINGLERYPQ